MNLEEDNRRSLMKYLHLPGIQPGKRLLRALGAQKHLIFILILAHTITIALIGSIVGIALGKAEQKQPQPCFKSVLLLIIVAAMVRIRICLQTCKILDLLFSGGRAPTKWIR